MKTAAFPALLAAALTIAGLSACNKPGERDEPGGLPRETVPMSVPPMPGDPRPPPESTVPPDSPAAPNPLSGTPPLPIGKDRERPASSDDTAQRILQDGRLV